MAYLLDNWCLIPTPWGDFRMYDTGNESVRVVCFGDIYQQGEKPLLRMHSSCLASEVFAATDCDCADQLRESMQRIAQEARGIIVHLHQEGRGHGLSKKIRAVHLMQFEMLDTVQAFDHLELKQDIRTYEEVIRLLRLLKITSVRLISNNPNKVNYLGSNNIEVESVNTTPLVRKENLDYLTTKRIKLGHQLPSHDQAIYSGDIRFYSSKEPWGELSNFSPYGIKLKAEYWPTVEHCYQAQKFIESSLQQQIRGCATPSQAKQLAHQFQKQQRPEWSQCKEDIMLRCLRAKFQQHPQLAERLLSSGNLRLVEHTKDDSYWGDAGDGSGLNRLGALLMQIREELRNQRLTPEG